ncbi:MAG: FeoA family protein [Syntrophorhabdus sp.]
MRKNCLRKGKKLRLASIEASDSIVRHLNGMGFVNGVEFEIISGHNPYIIELKGSRLALSAELLQCFRVS